MPRFILPVWPSFFHTDLSWPICCICCWAAANFTYAAVYSPLPLSANYYLPVPAPSADKTPTAFTFPMSSALAAVSCSVARCLSFWYFLCVSRRLPGFPASIPSVQRINPPHALKNLFWVSNRFATDQLEQVTNQSFWYIDTIKCVSCTLSNTALQKTFEVHCIKHYASSSPT